MPSTCPLTLDFATPSNRPTNISMAQALEMEIFFGSLLPGDRLIEDDLMARFDQSRHRVRSAINTLAQRGLAVRETNKGAHVCCYDRKQILELYALRHILQDAAIASIALPVKPETITRLLILNEAQATATAREDLEEIFCLNNQFLRTFFSCCNNNELHAAIVTQARRTYPIRADNLGNATDIAAIQKEHHEMIQALSQGDLTKLSLLMRAHTERPMHNYLAQYSPRSECK